MESLRIGIPRARDSASTDLFDVLCDYGTGIIDENAPLNDRPLPYWPSATQCTEHLIHSHMTLSHLDDVQPDGHLENRHLLDQHCWPAGIIDFVTPPIYFGKVKLVIRSLKGRHHAMSMSKSITLTANSAPRPIHVIESVTMVDDALTFSLQASPDL